MLFDFIVPPKCHLCGEPLSDAEDYICNFCETMLPRSLYHKMPGNPFEERFAGVFPFERGTGYLFYTPSGPVAHIIESFKYRNFPALAYRLGEIMGNELYLTGFLSDIDIIVPMPINWRKRLRRGYNQTEYLAAGVSAALPVEIPISRALKAHRHHATQTSKSHEERRKNVGGVFKLANPDLFAGKHILLLDDVCTTGATLTSAAETILGVAPTARITLLTLAVTI